jgi:adenosine deaminase
LTTRVVALLKAGVRVAICCDNTTVSRTDQAEESLRVAEQVGVDQVEAIHAAAGGSSFIRPESRLAR